MPAFALHCIQSGPMVGVIAQCVEVRPDLFALSDKALLTKKSTKEISSSLNLIILDFRYHPPDITCPRDGRPQARKHPCKARERRNMRCPTAPGGPVGLR